MNVAQRRAAVLSIIALTILAVVANPIEFDVRRTATFTGRFRLRLHGQRTVYGLQIESVENITITPVRQAEPGKSQP